MKQTEFEGLTEETYRFFWDIAFHNDTGYFEENRARYRACVQAPLLRLAASLADTVLEIDDRLNVRPSAVLSRIRRDTRYTKDKSPYRDHAWLGYRMPHSYISENFTIYAEVERDAYGYGMGMYSPDAARMREFRARIQAAPEEFLSLVNEKAFAERFTLSGEDFKRDRFPDAEAALKPYFNKKCLSFCFSSNAISHTMTPAFSDELREAFLCMRPVYRFLMGLPVS